jgi:hypothetical protein
MTSQQIEQLLWLKIIEKEADSDWIVILPGDFKEDPASGPTRPARLVLIHER